LVVCIGFKGDVHLGKIVKYRSPVAKDPSLPNLRQVHLFYQELFDDLFEQGYEIVAGQIGGEHTAVFRF